MNRTRREFLAGTAGAMALPLFAGSVFAQSGGSLRIGALNPVTGAGGPYGEGMQKMILAAAEAINAAGGAAGSKIEIFAEDTQTDPQAAVLAAKKLIEVNKVEAVLGTWSSGISLAVIPLTNDAGKILMHTSGAPALSVPPANEKGLGYRFQATNDRFGRAFAEIAEKEGFKRPATMAFNNASGIGNTEGFKKAWTAKGGEVVSEVVYEPKQASYRSELMQILATQPDVIVTGSYVGDTTIILREWYQTGQPVKWIIPGWAANSDLVAALGADVVEGIISVDSISNEKAPSFAAYDKAYQAAMGKPGTDNVYAAMTWDMMTVLALAVEAAGSTDMAKVNEKMRDVANPEGTKVYTFAEGKEALKSGPINYEGASSVLDFDEHGDVTPDFSASFVEDGKINRRYVVKI